MKKKNEESGFWTTLFKLLKLEAMTTHGKFNLGALAILLFFSITYTVSDKACYLISAVGDVLKSIALNKDISHPYRTDNVFKLFIPSVILIVFCFGFLYLQEKAKEKSGKTK